MTHKIILSLIMILCSCQLRAQPAGELPRVAHAGGRVNGATYTNSLEALDANFAAGFRAFEIDLSWTSDRQLVCLHDWEESFERSFGLPPGPAVTANEFDRLVRDHSPLTQCTLASLMDWFSEHPDTRLITDIKESNLEALAQIAADYPQLLQRIIPQIYQPDEYLPVSRLGFDNLIWTLYEYPGGTRSVLDLSSTMNLFAVTMNTDRVQQNLPGALAARGIATYAHTVNHYADLLYLKSLGIDEIYTDDLSPARQQELQLTGESKAEDSPLLQAEMSRTRSRERRIEQFFYLPRTLYSLKEHFDPTAVASNQVTIQVRQPGQLEIAASGSDPYIVFPPIPDATGEIGIYIELEVPDSSVLEIFYTTRAEPDYATDRRIAERVEAGENRVAIGLNESSPVTQLRLDPGTIPGIYRIRRFEVRSQSRSIFRFLRRN